MLSLLLLIHLFLGATHACNPRQVENGTICVCDSNSCDEVPGLSDMPSQGLKVYTTSSTQAGFNTQLGGFSPSESSAVTKIKIDKSRTHQKIVGFGGAFTDSATSNILSLPEAAQEKLLESYFGETGIGYTLNRLPIGGCDFSPRLYSLDDTDGDVNLDRFALQPEDLNYKIPIVKRALELMGNRTLKLFATPWTAPPWMKSSPIWSSGYNVLKPENYQVWANYILKFFDEYQKQGIEFWGVTTGNEPVNGFAPYNPVPNMGWTTSDQLKWIVENLGPTLKNSTHKDVKIIVHDENIGIFPFDVPVFLSDEKCLQYVDGVATHWYADGNLDNQVRYLAKSDKKDIALFSSEACHFMTQPWLGSWERAAKYAENIITDLQYDYVGWVDWNMVLDSTGGFTYINLPADAPIILSENKTEFYKQPMFYVMGHFSKFVVPDSVRVHADVETSNGNVQVVAFNRPDNLTVVVVYNGGDNSESVQINDNNRFSDVLEISPKSLNTVIY